MSQIHSVLRDMLDARHIREMYRANKHAVHAENISMLRVVSVMCSVLFALMLLFNGLRDRNDPYLKIFTIGMSLSILMAIISIRAKSSAKYITPLLYFVTSCSTFYGLYSGLFISPENPSVTFMVMQVMLPLVVLDLPLRININTILWGIIYTVIALNRQTAEILAINITNAFAFTAIGVFVGRYITIVKLNAADTKRLIILQRDTDSLTTLSNRRRLFEVLGQDEALNSVARINGVIMCDLDFFKQYNDTYGHQAGDECLAKVGAYLNKFAESHGAQSFRYGGEEFIVLCRAESGEGLSRIAKELVDGFAELRIVSEKSPLGYITLSAGYADADTCRPKGYDGLISMADTALYSAKSTGRRKAVGYTPDIEKSAEVSPRA